MASIEESKRKYAHLFDKDLLDEVETWDAYGQAFFWEYASLRIPQVQDENMIRRMERDKQEHVKQDEELAPLPFKVAEQTMTPSGYFGRSIASRILEGQRWSF